MEQISVYYDDRDVPTEIIHIISRMIMNKKHERHLRSGKFAEGE
ncbi:MAG: hypothetical protein ACI4R7_03785 [Oliverpabstia sp.]